MAKRWSVVLPITGTFYVEVEADSEDEAIDKALNGDEWPNKPEPEWEVHRAIVTGNVFHGMQNEAEATRIDDGEDD